MPVKGPAKHYPLETLKQEAASERILGSCLIQVSISRTSWPAPRAVHSEAQSPWERKHATQGKIPFWNQVPDSHNMLGNIHPEEAETGKPRWWMSEDDRWTIPSIPPGPQGHRSLWLKQMRREHPCWPIRNGGSHPSLLKGRSTGHHMANIQMTS